MRKSINLLILLMATVLTMSMTSCRETNEDKAEDAIDNVEDGVEDAADEVGDAAEDVGDELEDATDDS
ncbi:phasin family protein [Allomuricauda sp. F6463D]|uniref:phasin family protein n=1 Tax=Allomuricauda sp. F6463D TaxID=2926409 RepID=UPI001FF550AD|nr:phasin family protein [Muricauda sp. F6463D]MCK0161573.1 phasin family protein [Muricauda sp. F6463D]